MTTIICPKCGTENPADAVNCKNCKVNLKYALEHPAEMEFAQEHPDMFGLMKQEAVREEAVRSTPEKAMSRKQARKKRGLIYLAIAVACFVILFLMSTGDTGGGAIGAFLVLATLICFVGGIIYLIGGFVGKE